MSQERLTRNIRKFLQSTMRLVIKLGQIKGLGTILLSCAVVVPLITCTEGCLVCREGSSSFFLKEQ